MSEEGDKKAWEHAIYAMGDFLEDDEKTKLVRALMEKRGDAGATEAEAESLVAWARGVKVASALLDNVLRGRMLVDWREGDEPTFTLSATGTAYAERIARKMGLP